MTQRLASASAGRVWAATGLRRVMVPDVTHEHAHTQLTVKDAKGSAAVPPVNVHVIYVAFFFFFSRKVMSYRRQR